TFYNLCLPKQCGDVINIRYPFFIKNIQDPLCGHPRFELECNNGSAVIQIAGNKYFVKGIEYERKSVRLITTASESDKEVCPNVVLAPVELEDDNTVVDGRNYTEVMDRGITSTWLETDCGECEKVVEDVGIMRLASGSCVSAPIGVIVEVA
nr:leaf rust 10 disease-resistance locus receptor-like protein kinase-like 1.2 [Tanacetum cinerariifolium]